MAEKTVLVTGDAGFTGKHLVSYLSKKGYSVFGLRQSDEKAIDLADKNALSKFILNTKPEYVIHLAGIAFVEHEDQLEIYKTNLFGTLNLLQAIKEAKYYPEKIIIASSANVYGSPKKSIIDENFCPAPVNHYASSKLAMEHMVKSLFPDFPVIITRSFNYTGIGQDKVFLAPKLVWHFANKKPQIRLGNIDVIREFNDVRFVIDCYLKLLESNVIGETVNLCTGTGHTIQDLLDILSTISGYMPEIIIDEDFIRPNEIKKLIGSPSKLYALTKNQEMLIPIKDTLSWMYDWFKLNA